MKRKPGGRDAPRILIVEDEPLVAQDLAYFVTDAGFRVGGPFSAVEQALAALPKAAPPAIAILDVKLRDGEIYPLADRLRELGVPMIFHSAHVNERDIVQRYPSARVCCKPFDASLLRQVIDDVVASRSSPRK